LKKGRLRSGEQGGKAGGIAQMTATTTHGIMITEVVKKSGIDTPIETTDMIATTERDLFQKTSYLLKIQERATILQKLMATIRADKTQDPLDINFLPLDLETLLNQTLHSKYKNKPAPKDLYFKRDLKNHRKWLN
jgi:hypothetical protein